MALSAGRALFQATFRGRIVPPEARQSSKSQPNKHIMVKTAPLTIRFLGELQVERAGELQPFPPSKKTRALLAYLALNNKSFRRDTLCELLWEIPDDPKGSLRWSLSKLRRLVDDDSKCRIVADRIQVGFDTENSVIDVLELQRLCEKDLALVELEELKHACQIFSGKFLDGLDLPNFPEFYLWCIAERERATQCQAQLLSAINKRLDGDSAISYARQLVNLVPEEERYHVDLIQRLVHLNRVNDAKQQVEISKKMLREAGQTQFDALMFALRSPTPNSKTKNQVTFETINDIDITNQVITETQQSAQDPSTPFTVRLEDALAYSRRKLVGRDAEIEQLVLAFRRSVESTAAKVVLIRGEPGIGKSSLIKTTVRLAEMSDAWFLHADAFESETIRPFALWNDAYRRSTRLSLPEALSSSENSSRDKILAGLSDNVGRLAAQKPFIIIFDDVQWCDDSSAAALHYILRMHRKKPVFAIIAAREQELQQNAAMLQTLSGLRGDHLLQELKLGPLATVSLIPLINNLFPNVNAEQLSVESGGNPLLAIELSRAAATGSRSQSLLESIRERLSRFDKTVNDVLEWAAILAPHLETKTLKRVTELDLTTLQNAIDIGEQQGILTIDERGLSFTHELIGRGIYDLISPARKRSMHHRAAEILEVETALDLQLASELAHHAEKSGDAAMAARAMVSAGRLCMRFFANAEATAIAKKGLAFAQHLTDADRVCLTLELNEILWTAVPVDNWQAAAEESIALAESALDYGALPYARLGYQLASYLRWLHGDWKDAQKNSLQAERITRGGNDADQIMGMAEAAKCLALLEKDLSHADALVMEASSLAKRKAIHLPVIATALGILRYHENDLDRAEEYLEEARMSYKANGDRFNEFLAVEYLCVVEIERENFTEAKRRCKQLLALGENLKDGSEAPYARAMDALCHYALTGDEQPLEQPLKDLRLCDAKHRLSYILIRAALIDLANNNADSASIRGHEALSHAQLLNRHSEQMLAHMVLALANQMKQQNIEAELHLNAIHEIDKLPVAAWARQRAVNSLAEFE